MDIGRLSQVFWSKVETDYEIDIIWGKGDHSEGLVLKVEGLSKKGRNYESSNFRTEFEATQGSQKI